MNHHSGSLTKGINTARSAAVGGLFLVALATSLCTPLIGEQQDTGENHSFMLHGRQVTIPAFVAPGSVPAIGTQQNSGGNRSFLLHGRQVAIPSFAAPGSVPVIGGQQNLGEIHSFMLHGREVTIPSFTAQGGAHADPPGSIEPVPIPGGLLIPPLIHVFAPGPLDQGFQGIDVEPNVITNFNGFVALAYPGGIGTATDSDGNTYDLVTDMRVFQGEYVSVDGTHHRGTFVLI
jgi:hypothetical protein